MKPVIFEYNSYTINIAILMITAHNIAMFVGWRFDITGRGVFIKSVFFLNIFRLIAAIKAYIIERRTKFKAR